MVGHSLRAALLVTTMIVGASGTSAYAQAVNPTPADESETIIVTGSRIASPLLESASPLQIVDQAAIQSTGAANVQDVLLQNPVFGTPAVSRTNSNFSTSGAGLATIDLRNLGTSRTLVLVDGRRFVSGSPNDQAVDLNSIPTSFIERVDVLTGGASSIYGSDAVAGVVNFIYRKNFQGLEANVQRGISERGDDSKQQYNLTIGANFNEGKGNIITYAGYSKDGSVLSQDRARSAIDQGSLGGLSTGDVGDLFTLIKPNFSSFAPQGRFFNAPGATAGTFDANGNFIPGFSINGTPTRAADGYNRSAVRTIAVPVERFLLATRANYEVAPAINVFVEGTFAKSHVTTQLEPFAISSAGTNGIFQGTGGFFNVEQRLPGGAIYVNPFVPAALLATLTDNTGDGLRDVSFTRRLTDIGNRTSTADRTTYRVVVGVEGDFAKGWHYDAFFNYGRTDDNQTGTGQVNLFNFRAALAVVPDANGNPVCQDVNARSQGCVPVNIFGANTLTPQQAAYIRADSNRQAFASQKDVGANISGSLGDYWGAGEIGLAAGFEYRKESSSASFDALSQAGQNGGNAIPNTRGSFDVTEGYGEIRVPLLTDRPFFHALELRGAARVSKYSSIGTVYSYNYGAEFSPVADIRFRGVVARATRAPNVSELFQGASQTFPTGIIDPCIGVTATTAGTLGTTCRSFAGVNANIAANGGAFAVTQPDAQGISGFDTGNPNLKQETADTLTAGVVINPRSINALRNFTVTVDYSKTRIKGAIVSTPRQFILSQCFQQGNQGFCQFVTRRPAPEGANSAGSLQFINSGASNSGGVYSSSIDVTVGYHQSLDTFGLKGNVNMSVAYTHLLDGYSIPLPGAPIDYFAGEVGASRDRFLATVGFSTGAFSLEYRGTYIGKAYLDDQFVAQLTDTDPVSGVDRGPVDRHDPRVKIAPKFYSDLQAKFGAGDHYEFYVGVNNLFDVTPPPIYSGLPGDTTGAETDSGTYDAIGRRYYAGVRLKL
ncbi:MAG: TonB-dependent receptor [Sphingomonadales bacterium]|nr:TonB-dependent receptor [Sphingomonadales bacterium]